MSQRRPAAAAAPSLEPVAPQYAALPPFVGRLLTMLERPDCAAYIRWGADGKSVAITGVDAFTSSCLPRFFRTSNFASFVRQFHLYNFKKVADDGEGALGSPFLLFLRMCCRFIRYEAYSGSALRII